MPSDWRDPRPVTFAALTVIAGLGSCLIGVVCIVPTLIQPLAPWPALAGGVVAVVVALGALWRLERRRDGRIG